MCSITRFRLELVGDVEIGWWLLSPRRPTAIRLEGLSARLPGNKKIPCGQPATSALGVLVGIRFVRCACF